MDVNESLERAAALRAEADEAERAAAAADENQSFDDFWAEVEAKHKPRTETIRGVTVRVPTRASMRFKRRLASLDIHNTSEEEVNQFLAELFGGDVLEKWIDAGMGEEELAVVMAWAIACTLGREITWREAYETITTGKAPARLAKEKALAAKTGASTQQSDGTGGQSKPRSQRSTRRRRKR